MKVTLCKDQLLISPPETNKGCRTRSSVNLHKLNVKQMSSKTPEQQSEDLVVSLVQLLSTLELT